MLVGVGILVIAYHLWPPVPSPLDGKWRVYKNFLDEDAPLSPKEIEKAKEVFLQERERWERFKGLSADVQLHYLDTISGEEGNCEGTISIRGVKRDPAADQAGPAWRYVVIVKGKDGAWTYTDDGTGEMGSFDTDDYDIIAPIIDAFPTGGLSFWLAWARETMLSAGSEGGLGIDEFFEEYLPIRSLDAPDSPDTFVLLQAGKNASYIVFEGGHITWRASGRPGGEKFHVTYGSYVEKGETAFPTLIEGHEGTMVTLTIRLANVKFD